MPDVGRVVEWDGVLHMLLAAVRDQLVVGVMS
jgi:hypothetical protein